MKQQLKFPGFPEKPVENYWQYPKVMNGYWHKLTGIEQKVLDYILRHTWGYQKNADKISLSQFKNGITIKKTGEIVDLGIGIKRNEDILKAIKQLEKLGFIKTIQKPGKIKEFQLVRQMNNPCPTGEQVGCPDVRTHNNNVTIDNKTIYTSKEVGKSLHPSYGNEEINNLITFLKEELGGSPDGTQKENRRFAHLLLNKVKRDYPNKNSVEIIQFLIQAGLKDNFHGKNLTNFKYLFYHTQQIIQSIKGRGSKVIKI